MQYFVKQNGVYNRNNEVSQSMLSQST
jgi:hypothetical protein